MREIYKIIGVSVSSLIGLFFLLVLQSGFDIMETWMIRMLMDVAQKNQEIIGMCLGLFFLILAEGSAGAVVGWIIGRMMITGRKSIQFYLANKLLDCSYSTLSEIGVGEILTRLQVDSRQCVESIRYVLQTVVYGSILLIGPILVCFFISWQLTLLSMLMVPIIFVLSIKFSKKIGSASEVLQKQEGKANQIFQEFIWQIPTSKAYSAAEEWNRHLEQTFNKLHQAKNGKVVSQLLYEPFLNIVQLLPQIIIISAGGCLLIQRKITVGDLMLFTIFLGYISNGMIGIPQWIAELRQFYGHGKRVLELMELSPLSGKEIEKKEGSDIRLKEIQFCYSDKKIVLDNVTVTIKKGMHVAIVGKSGCGKTTLLKILSGLQKPQKGEASVLGYDLLQCQPEQLFSHLALILQDTYLFPGTIRENLTAGKERISSEQLEKICKKARIWDWISSLPNGIDTMLAEFSSNISGGQKQRIGIARAILRNAELWLIDEPTSSLDSLTAREIMDNLKEITENKTTVTVTHDLQNMERYDLILVMEKGTVVESGTHEELIKKEGLYTNLYHKGGGISGETSIII